MKKIKILLPLFFIWMITLYSSAQDPIPAFPGAEGHGKYVTGGRGGQVYYVTHLNDDKTMGSLRKGVEMSGARIIIFKVSGTIQLKSDLEIENNNIEL